MTRVRWNGTSDGPWVHIDTVIEHLEETKRSISDATDPAMVKAAQPLLALIDALVEAWRASKLTAVQQRLDAVASNVSIESLTNDLLELRDELEDRREDG